MNEIKSAELKSYSDEELLTNLAGFENKFISTSAIKLHYVEGGNGDPLICLPGWPQTWYSLKPVAM